MKKTARFIKNYWEERARQWKNNPRATTNDYFLRELEINKIIEALRLIPGKRYILDVGCGDGFSTLKLCEAFPQCHFIGVDYSIEMIKNARTNLNEFSSNRRKNITFLEYDVNYLSSLNKNFDVIISDRCLINLVNRKSQQKAITEIIKSLKPKGFYIMVENFLEGHNGMNKLRNKLSLPEIPIRWHNLYFDQSYVNNYIKKYFRILKQENISSIYYLITRVVYSKMCQVEKREPDYEHIIYKIANALEESVGNYGPVNLLLLQKID